MKDRNPLARLAKSHRKDIVAYRDNFLLPSIAPLEFQLNNSSVKWTDSEQLDLLHLEAGKALFLALQALWERQLREYLRKAGQAHSDRALVETASGRNLGTIEKVVSSISGLSIATAFQRYDEFKHVANVCRHGTGDSLTALWKEHRAKWWLSSFDAEEATAHLWNLRISAAEIHKFAGYAENYWAGVARAKSPATEES